MLGKVLDKLNINYEDLTTEEQETYKRWEIALEGKEFTLDELKKLLLKEIELHEYDLLNYDNDPIKDLALKMRLRNYKIILSFASAPDKNKERVKEEIKNKFKINI